MYTCMHTFELHTHGLATHVHTEEHTHTYKHTHTSTGNTKQHQVKLTSVLNKSTVELHRVLKEKNSAYGHPQPTSCNTAMVCLRKCSGHKRPVTKPCKPTTEPHRALFPLSRWLFGNGSLCRRCRHRFQGYMLMNSRRRDTINHYTH